MPTVLKSLNALRVMAEFWVVHLHFISSSVNPSLGAFITSLMSFFFVLSGFVITHNYKGDDMATFQSKKRFWWRRFSRLYPTYFFFWLIAFIHVAASGEFNRSPKDLVCHFMQLPMLSNWMGCGASISNPPSWYVITLWWFWFLFPWLLPKLQRSPYKWPWTKIVVLNTILFTLVAAMFPLGYWFYTPLPPVRFLEFYIGCIAATTIETRIHWAWPLLSTLLFVVFYVGMFYTTVFVPNKCEGGLWSFLDSIPFTNYCMLNWAYMSTTKFAFMWAMIIQWAAASEYHDIPNRPLKFLEESHLLQTMSTYSLQLYLGHFPVYKLLIGLSAHLLIESQWRLNTIFIAVYGICYLFKLYMQPCMDRALKTKTAAPTLAKHQDDAAVYAPGGQTPAEPTVEPAFDQCLTSAMQTA
jgi:peptidoglycan/LPS O-acetylase OafA/YrhL